MLKVKNNYIKNIKKKKIINSDFKSIYLNKLRDEKYKKN